MPLVSHANAISNIQCKEESIFHKQNNALSILTKKVRITKHTVGGEIGLTCLWDK